FDLARDPMLRAVLLKLDTQNHVLIVTMHHIASDGWSISIFINELCALYQAFANGVADAASCLPPLPLQYADYAAWQRNWLQGPVLEQQMAYWEKQLASLPAVHGLPLDFPRPKIQGFKGAAHTLALDPASSTSLQALCQQHGATLFMGLHAALAVLLARYSNESDIVIGSPIANREQADIAGLIGFFLNTLVLRSEVRAGAGFADLLQQSKRTLLDAYAHQQVPFEQIVERLQPERSLSHSPLFQIMLVLQNNEQGKLDLPGLSLEPLNIADTVAKYDLTLNVSEGGNGQPLQLVWEYNCELFAQSSIERMAKHFVVLLQAMLAAPERNVYALELLDPAQRAQQLLDWNDTFTQRSPNLALHQAFEAQVARRPQALALVQSGSNGASGASLSYEELNRRANALARHLRAEVPIEADTIIGLALPRGADMIVAILAILKAGAAYLALDPSYPPARLEHMLQDARPVLVLTHGDISAKLPLGQTRAICLDQSALQSTLLAGSGDNLPVPEGFSSSTLAYVIYSSGSTGVPKASLLNHGALLNLALAQIDGFAINEASRVLQFASIAFDAASSEWSTALLSGATLVLIDNDTAKDPQALSQVVAQQQLTHATLPPVLLPLLQQSQWQSLQTLVVAGDVCSPALAAQWAAGRRFINAYGPSETTVCATMGEYDGRLHIGKPLPNVSVYVLNAAHSLVPVGACGQLYIGGAGLSRGYLRRDELNAEKFIANPYYDPARPGSSARLYQSGDLVRWLPDGNLEFLGRIDHQIKLRGFRIELGEIENTLKQHAAVKDALVLAMAANGAGDDKQLVAWVVPKQAVSGEGEDSQANLIVQLRQHLAHSLPDYMVPAAFMLLAAMPLDPNGKLDRKALPEPDFASQQAIYCAPRTEVETVFCQLWQEVLKVERVGIHDNFFRLGGHSLSATRLISRINQTFQVQLPIKALFLAPDLEALVLEMLRLDSGQACPPLVPVARDQELPVSFGQQRLWLLDRIDGGSAHYNMPGALQLTGELNYDALQTAFLQILARHESLRTCFVSGPSGEPQQKIHPVQDLPFTIPMVDLSLMADDLRQQQLQDRLRSEAVQPFRLQSDLMLRAQLLKMGEQQHVLMMTMHHIAADGWSMSILINEFCALYQAALDQAEGRAAAAPLPPLPIQYADYAHWQRNWLVGEVLQRQLAYWDTQLAGLPVVHGVPFDHPRPKLQTYVGAMHYGKIDSSITHGLKALCQQGGATLFMGLHAAFSAFLARYSNETDIVLGSPIANREQVEVAGLIGFFVNTLVLRLDLSNDPALRQLLQQSRRVLLDAYAHQQVPFEQIVERLQPRRSLSHSPLFQIMLVLQNNEEGTLDLPGLTLAPVEQGGNIAKYDLTLTVGETADGMQLAWEYNTALFGAETIERMAGHFTAMLAAMVQAPDTSIHAVPMLSAAERSQMLQSWNATAIDYPQHLCVQQLFEQQVAAQPEATALVCGDSTLSYAELNARANQLAHKLVAQHGCQADSLIGICATRSVAMVVAVLAVLKAGAAYVPLDPEYPAARLDYMIADAGLDLVLANQAGRANLSLNDDQVWVLDQPQFEQDLAARGAGNGDNIEPAARGLSSQHLAYVIYTSGSTGNPKGVMLRHSGVVNYLSYVRRCYFEAAAGGAAAGAATDGAATDGVALAVASSPLAFDATVTSLLGPLVSGKCLHLIAQDGRDIEHLGQQLINSTRPTLFKITPAHLEGLSYYLENRSVPDLPHRLIIGGDQLSTKLALNWKNNILPSALLVNEYGPTETVVGCATLMVRDGDQLDAEAAAVPIGKPIDNTSLFVLDSRLQPVPLQVAGELFIGGAGVARGYLRRDDLTAEKFIANPFHDPANPASSATLYRSGDLARWDTSGNLVFLGRIDHQVKIRGFRIEIGEIETVLAVHPGVKECVVLARESSDGEKRLVAYLVANEAAMMASGGEEQPVLESVRQHLSQRLPDYMVPAAQMMLPALPLTVNGKIDRAALPEPDMTQSRVAYVAPGNATEEALCQLWQELLDVPQVGINDNFFSLGGHSLLAMKLLTSLESRFKVSLDVKIIFQFPDLAGLAAYLEVINPIVAASEGGNGAEGAEGEEEMENFQI
ncbi:MAG: hypothetical protein RL748_3383, partial [Pseudomonadota bacterium]